MNYSFRVFVKHQFHWGDHIVVVFSPSFLCVCWEGKALQTSAATEVRVTPLSFLAISRSAFFGGKSITNLSSYSSKSYTSIVLGDFEVSFLMGTKALQTSAATAVRFTPLSFSAILKSAFLRSKSITNLSSYSSKSYDSIVLGDFEVTSLGKKEDATFRSFLSCILFTHGVA